jgi:hypothetical protein
MTWWRPSVRAITLAARRQRRTHLPASNRVLGHMVGSRTIRYNQPQMLSGVRNR